MADNSVHCVITSPPYWSLRDYGLTPSVWDEPLRENSEDPHIHQWEAAGSMIKRGAPIATSMSYEKGAARLHVTKTGEFCPCGAWRGVLGLEPTVDLYIQHLGDIFDEVKRVLRPDGIAWLNIGDCYDSKTKQRWLVPHRLALALQARGWIVRSDIIWAKGISFCPSYAGSVMPESVRDRPTCSHEHVLMLTKEPRYFYDYEAIREQGRIPAGTFGAKGSGTREGNRRGQQKYPDASDPILKGKASYGGGQDGYWKYDGKRNPRDVWAINTKPFRAAHFATFPPGLVEPLLRAGSSPYVCSACRAPYQHVVERSPVPLEIQEQLESARTRSATATGRSDGHTSYKPSKGYQRRILADAYTRKCECPDGAPIPSTVLDPFMGAGTTGLVARRHGRRFIGLDAQPTYIALARERIAAVQWGDAIRLLDPQLRPTEGEAFGVQGLAGAERHDCGGAPGTSTIDGRVRSEGVPLHLLEGGIQPPETDGNGYGYGV